ncbi:hypothetical protein [Jeotgalibaca porci]|uniref:hypothetical protein n=1 Tax=Jeotgalibaca porci TaxID=1868793 RepID=UPI0035A0C9D7
MKVKFLLKLLEHREPRINILGSGHDAVIFNVPPHIIPEYEHLGELEVKKFEIHMDDSASYMATEKCEENEGALTDVTNESVIVVWV